MSRSASLIVETAELPGGDKPSEDRIFITPNAAIILDGATQAIKLERDGAWIAQELGQLLADGLTAEPGCELPPLLERSIAHLVATYDLVPGQSPSATVSIVRLIDDRLDVMVLCDSPVIVLDRDGQIHQIRDDRLDEIAKSIERPPGKRDMTDPRWIKTVEEFEAHRNRTDGFWVPSASPEAAHHCIQQSFDAGAVDTALLLTDGASAGVDSYGAPATWFEGVEIAKRSAEEFVALVQATELTDPDCTLWPRSKPHDDKTIAVASPDT